MFLKHVQESKKIRFSNLMRIQKNIKVLKILKKEQKKYLQYTVKSKPNQPTNKNSLLKGDQFAFHHVSLSHW